MHLDISKGPDGYYITLTDPEPASYYYSDLEDALAELEALVRVRELKTEEVELCIYGAAIDDIQTLLGEAGMEKWLNGLGLARSPSDQGRAGTSQEGAA